MLNHITWLGHDTFRIDTDGKVIYFDPYKIKGGVPADIIFITHGHFDHCSPDDLKRIVKPSTIIVSDVTCAERLKGKAKAILPGDKQIVAGVEVEAVPAYNIDKKYHPKSQRMVGFIIQLNGVKIYHAGDSDLIPEMKAIKTDIALLPVGGTFTMTADEAIQAALLIKPKIAVPMHYGTEVGTEADALKFSNGLKGKVEVVILKQAE